ncbi:MAG: alcohol dehydrogenase catalytic domain-containing protein [Magnetococcales bacterium]|nr:alcohol dehydrogenase catalytic domain-containing protein [Magnetococcales bacterium]
MKGVWLEQGRVALRDDLARPERAPGQALIRVTMVGICGTDMAMLRGYADYQGVPGHEFVGVVEAADDHAWIGARVVGVINITCGRCDPCLRGDHAHCRFRRVLGIRDWSGAMAEYLVLPEINLLRVPEEVADLQAVFAEPLAATLEVLAHHHVRPTQRVAVVGDGRLGQLMAQTLRLTGAETVLIGRHQEKLDLARRVGLKTAQARDLSTVDAVWDLVVECSGAVGGFQLARRLVRPRGTLVLKSALTEPPPLDLTALMIEEVTLAGSRCGPMAPALRLLATKAVHVLPLVASVYSLDKAEEAFEHAGRKGVIKVLIRP